MNAAVTYDAGWQVVIDGDMPRDIEVTMAVSNRQAHSH
jgi:hypothetical protein